jgi:type IV pilus assembly protein PilB
MMPQVFLHRQDGQVVMGMALTGFSFGEQSLTLDDETVKFAEISFVYLPPNMAKALLRHHPPDETVFEKCVSGAYEFAGRIIHRVQHSVVVMYLDKFSHQVCVIIPKGMDYQVQDKGAPSLSYDDNLADSIIMSAISREASDIHIKPEEHRSVIQFRIDGQLQDVNELPVKRHASLLSKLKNMANMDIAERRMPQDGGATVQQEGRSIDLRFSTAPTITGESLVIRILDPQLGLKTLQQIGFFPEDEQAMRQVLAKRGGLVLVTGPTGAGKSTTMYAVMDSIRSFGLNVISIEDPVEYRIADVKQIEVNHRIGNSFAKALRHVLRHDPDVILIGEIRDQDTAKIAVESALTGHLVISTLHTRNCAYSISRLLEMGVESYQIRDTLQAVLAQRLVRKFCPACLGQGECEVCGNSGFKGRAVVYEWLEMDDELGALVTADFSVSQFASLARRKGMRTLEEHGQALVAAGVTHGDEVFVR